MSELLGKFLHFLTTSFFIGKSKDDAIVWEGGIFDGLDGRNKDFFPLVICGHDDCVKDFLRIGVFATHGSYHFKILDVLIKMIAPAVFIAQTFESLVRMFEILKAFVPINFVH